jgi:hypothetical protein
LDFGKKDEVSSWAEAFLNAKNWLIKEVYLKGLLKKSFFFCSNNQLNSTI